MKEELCGCCEGLEILTPMLIANRPGLAALTYRVGTHAAFLETMKARLTDLYLEVPGDQGSAQKVKIYPLQPLTTREAKDPAIALLDAWATVADVLTFYQERIANEGYLRTAAERRSILELARLVGYRLHPGVAASAYLAFTLEEGHEVEIPLGTRAQSLPGPGEVPQPFETSEPLRARSEWNVLKPQMSKPQDIILCGSIPSGTIYFKGIGTNLKPNDPILFVFDDNGKELYRVEEVHPDASLDRTRVELLPWITDQNMIARVQPVEGVGPLVNDMKQQVSAFLDLEKFNVSPDSQMTKRVVEILNRLRQKLTPDITATELDNLLKQDIMPKLRAEHATAESRRFKTLEPWLRDMVKAFEDCENVLSTRYTESPHSSHSSNPSGLESGDHLNESNCNYVEEDFINFDYRMAEVKKLACRWKIVVGEISLLDFGNNRHEALRALQIIKHYGMNRRCYIGSLENPSMEYYLVNGQAPTGSFEGEDCVSFNPQNIEVKEIDGRWKIVEGSHWIMDFGDREDEANQACCIIKNYGFQYICFVGRPDPSMTYFRLHDVEEGTCINFDYRKAEVKKKSGRWKIVVGDESLLDFGSNQIEALRALQIIKHYGMNRRCYIGSLENPSMEYYLVNGQAPTGSFEGEDCVSFNPQNIEVKEIDGRWKIVEGSHWIMDFGDREDEARQAFGLIKKYGFEYICFVGRPDPSMTYFRRRKDSGLQGLIKPLKKAPSLQPANRFRMLRDLKVMFGESSDIIPKLLSSLNPTLKDTLYQAWGTVVTTEPPKFKSVETFRVKAAPFGHNAPNQPEFDGNGKVLKYNPWALVVQSGKRNLLPLDAQYDQITPGSLVFIERPNQINQSLVYRVEKVHTVSIADYGIAGRVTQLTLDRNWLGADDVDLSDIRDITVYALNESLTKEGLAEEPVEDDVEGDTIEFAELYDGLEAGRWIIVSGERTDISCMSGVKASELAMIAGVTQKFDQLRPDKQTHTVLKLANDLAYTYKRDTVTIFGNVVKATHGETINEVLGSGDATKVFQKFNPRKPPLTFIPASTPRGIESSLEVRVNDVRWHESESMTGLGPKDRNYVTEIDNEDKTSIIFGNGKQGARLPTGVENITAKYRSGIGKPGNVRAEQISMLATRPLGVKSVINPIHSSGGADRENRDQARRNTPLALHALDRLISLDDYANFARTFAGIGKASAAYLSDGRRQLVHVTIAGADDIPIDVTSDLYYNLCQALRRFGDPYQPIQVAVRELMLLIISAKVRLLSDYLWESVEPKIRSILLNTFSFARRQLGQDVTLAEVISTIQSVDGVCFVDVDILEAIDENLSVEEIVTKLQDLIEENLNEQPKPRILVETDRIERATAEQPRQIQAAQLAYLSPEVPETLILTEISQ